MIEGGWIHIVTTAAATAAAVVVAGIATAYLFHPLFNGSFVIR